MGTSFSVQVARRRARPRHQACTRTVMDFTNLTPRGYTIQQHTSRNFRTSLPFHRSKETALCATEDPNREAAQKLCAIVHCANGQPEMFGAGSEMPRVRYADPMVRESNNTNIAAAPNPQMFSGGDMAHN